MTTGELTRGGWANCRPDRRRSSKIGCTKNKFARSSRIVRLVPLIALLLACVPAKLAQSQRGDGQAYPRGEWGQAPPQTDSPYAGDNGNPAMEEKRLEALNAQRQKSMLADTDKLVTLAAELNREVSGKKPTELTPDQLRTVAKIEKLAHSVREKMSTSVKPAQPMPEPMPIMPNIR